MKRALADAVGEFVGRRSELRTLHAALGAVAIGGARVTVVEGAAGVGKTWLVERFLAEAGDHVLLRARGDETETDVPFGIVDQLLGEAAALDPAVAAADALGLGAAEHFAVGTRLLGLLDALQRAAPVVVLIDDGHWADAVSLRALRFASARLASDRVLVLLAIRDRPAPRLPDGLRRLAAGRTIRLPGLGVEELRELAARLGQPLTPRAAGRLHDHSGGSPLHARALLGEHPADLWEDLASELPAPRSYAALIRRRADACSPEARRLVQAAAVLGLHSPPASAARLAGLDDALAALGEAGDAGLLELGAGVRRVRFPHALTRAAVYRGLGASRRAALHARAAALTTDEATELRHRAAGAVGPDATLAADFEAFALREQARGAWAPAAMGLLAAGRASASVTARERRILQALEALLRAGDTPGARELAEEAEGFAPGPRRDGVLGYLAICEGRAADATLLLRRAWEQCEGGADIPVALAVARRNALLSALRLQASDAIAWSTRAMELAGMDAGRSAWALAFGLDLAGRRREARAVLDEHGGTRPSIMRGRLLLAAGELPAAREELAAAARCELDGGSLHRGAYAYAKLAEASYQAGAWDDAAVEAERSLALALESGNATVQAWARAAAALVPAARGDWAAAEGHLSAPPSAFEACAAAALIAAGELAAARRDWQAVWQVLRPVAAMEPRDGVDDPGYAPWAHLHAEALVGLGRLAEAEAFLDRHAAIARERGRRAMVGRLERVRGRLEAARGDAAAARRAFRAALAAAEPLGMPYELALTELAYGEFLRRGGGRRAAAAQLTAARERFAALGARPALGRCERELEACGLAPPARSETRDLRRLTPQERAVAGLAGDRKSNREIAAELMLSVKTVERHLTRVYAKLGLSSRTELH